MMALGNKWRQGRVVKEGKVCVCVCHETILSQTLNPFVKSSVVHNTPMFILHSVTIAEIV